MDNHASSSMAPRPGMFVRAISQVSSSAIGNEIAVRVRARAKLFHNALSAAGSWATAAEPGRQNITIDNVVVELSATPEGVTACVDAVHGTKLSGPYGVAITALFLVAILASLALALWEANAARHEADRAGEIQAFIENMFDPLEYNGTENNPLTVQEAFQQGFERATQAYPDDIRLRADLTALFARIDSQLGQASASQELLQRAYRFNEQAYGAEDERTLNARNTFAIALNRAGKPAEATAQLQAILDTMQRRGIHSTVRGSALNNLAFALVLIVVAGLLTLGGLLRSLRTPTGGAR